MDTLPKILPADFGSRDWRYGALGLTFNSLVTPLLGLVIAAAAALIADHRRTLQVVSVVFLAMGAFAAVGVLLFLVDFGGIAKGLGEASAPTFRAATWKAVVLALLLLPVAVWFGVGGLRAARSTPGEAGGGSGNLVVGQ